MVYTVKRFLKLDVVIGELYSVVVKINLVDKIRNILCFLNLLFNIKKQFYSCKAIKLTLFLGMALYYYSRFKT